MSTKRPKTIGILTGGGDVPGLNSCIKQVVIRAAELGMKVIGIRKGWEGLLAFHQDDNRTWDKNFQIMNPSIVRTIDRSGGTILHTSRTNPSAVSYKNAPRFLKENFGDPTRKRDYTEHVLSNLSHLEIDTLIPIGGDDTLSFALRLHQEGYPVVAIPKTMDNDVSGTDYCIGFSTAVTRSVNFIHALRTSAGSHERIAVVELFGRYCGETSLISAYLAGVDRAVISEVPFEVERLAEFLAKDRKHNPSHYAMLTISEGARMTDGEIFASGEADAYGHKKLGGIGEVTAAAIKKIAGVDIIFQPLLYLMRSGSPDSLDLMVALNYANMAIEQIRKNSSGYLMALNNGCYQPVDLNIVKAGAKKVDVDALYDTENYRPKITAVEGMPMFLY